MRSVDRTTLSPPVSTASAVRRPLVLPPKLDGILSELSLSLRNHLQHSFPDVNKYKWLTWLNAFLINFWCPALARRSRAARKRLFHRRSENTALRFFKSRTGVSEKTCANRSLPKTSTLSQSYNILLDRRIHNWTPLPASNA
jgi:hypothetical protein